MRQEEVYELIEKAPEGFDTMEYLDTQEWGDIDQYDNWKRREAVRSKIQLRISKLRKQGRIYKKDGRWWTTETLTPEPIGNRMRRIMVTYQGEERCLSEVCRERGANYNKTRMRVRHGWPLDEALTTPTLSPGQTRTKP